MVEPPLLYSENTPPPSGTTHLPHFPVSTGGGRRNDSVRSMLLRLGLLTRGSPLKEPLLLSRLELSVVDAVDAFLGASAPAMLPRL